MIIPFFVEPLASNHDRLGFSCGSRRRDRVFDDFLRNNALENSSHGQTFVIVPEIGATEIVAFFTLQPDPRLLMQIPAGEELQVENIWLRFVAVSALYQKQGIGRRVLQAVSDIVLNVADQHSAVESLVLQALDAEAKGCYLRRNLGFVEIGAALPVSVMRQALNAP